jgi:hypothetical protein
VSTTTDSHKAGAALWEPALAGGLVVGLLSALPVISAGNFCCCLWIISGGVIAAYVFQHNQPAPITTGDGALVGLLAGLVGAVIYLVVSIPVAPMERVLIERLVQTGNLPPRLQVYAAQNLRGAVRLVVGFLLMLVVGSAFSTLGGVLGAVLFRRSGTSGETTIG